MPMEYMLRSGETVEVEPEEWVGQILEWLEYAREHIGDRSKPPRPSEVAHGLAKATRNLRSLGTVMVEPFPYTMEDVERQANMDVDDVQEEIHNLYAETKSKESSAHKNGTFRVTEDYLATLEWLISTVRIMKEEIGGMMDGIASTR